MDNYRDEMYNMQMSLYAKAILASLDAAFIYVTPPKDGNISHPPCTVEELLASCGMKVEF